MRHVSSQEMVWVRSEVLTPTNQSYPGGVVNTRVATQTRVHIVDGEAIEVPVVSANSRRHELRTVLADLQLGVLGVKPGDLPARLLVLFYRGGALGRTADVGGRMSRADYAEVRRLFPAITLLGGAVRGRFEAAVISVSDWQAIVAEVGLTRLGIQGLPLFGPETLAEQREHLPRAASVIGTIHGVATNQTVAERTGTDGSEANLLPFQYEVIQPGTVLAGWIEPHVGATQVERDALAWALVTLYGQGEVVVGGHDATGSGRLRVEVDPDALHRLGEPERFLEHLKATREEAQSVLFRPGFVVPIDAPKTQDASENVTPAMDDDQG